MVSNPLIDAPQPRIPSWSFTRELEYPMHPPMVLDHDTPPERRALDFRGGLRLEWHVPDPEQRLKTAQDDFGDFLQSIGLRPDGPIPLRTTLSDRLEGEAFRIRIGKSGIDLTAGDREGIRRGLVEIENRILARRRAVLSYGVIQRKPLIRTRLSRCCFGPINRPPLCRDELLDDTDYYPDGYLNRLAHHGINALWITVRFRDLLPSSVLPELTPDIHASQRLTKLRRTIAQCSRYGIRVFLFCIEPTALPLDSPVLRVHPEIRGADAPGDRALFCTSNRTGQAYLEEMGRSLLTVAPGLGGLLCIPVGERFTHCYSGRLRINCPRCAVRKPWEVLADTLAALKRGMQAVDPTAELIAWPYGQLPVWGAPAMLAAAGNMPPGVVLQHNFETGGRERQLGKWRPLGDYWLSCVGPSQIFAACARAADLHQTSMYAKLQTSCSHEVATTQFVPVPGLLYRKYRRMHALGVRGAMLGWYFGNHPSLMTQATLRLSFAPFPKTEAVFLRELAAPLWGHRARDVALAWHHFADAYAHFPAAQRFSYYGPMQDGLVWPLHLKPRGLPLAPTWRNVHPLSGDQVSECVSADFSYDEILRLCRTLRDRWCRGTAILKRLPAKDIPNDEARRELNVALALEIHFDSGYNILLFYALREQLAQARDAERQKRTLARMRRIVRNEIDNGKRLLALRADNPWLGFHAEAEGFKYTPALLRRRIAQLRRLLENDFKRVDRECGRFPLPTFATYIGQGKALRSKPCRRVPKNVAWPDDPLAPEWDAVPANTCRHRAALRASDAARPFPFNSALHPLAAKEPWQAPPMQWRAVHDGRSLHLCLEWQSRENDPHRPDSERDEIRITVEPRPLQPFRVFMVGRKHPQPNAPALSASPPGWRDNQMRRTVSLPLAALDRDMPDDSGAPPPLRFNLSWFTDPIGDPLCPRGNPVLNTWAPMRRTLARNLLGYHDPNAYGWLVFDP